MKNKLNFLTKIYFCENRATTRRTTPSPRILTTTTEKGYNYPKPDVKFEIINEIINKKSVDLDVEVSYLPPVTETTKRTTTPR